MKKVYALLVKKNHTDHGYLPVAVQFSFNKEELDEIANAPIYSPSHEYEFESGVKYLIDKYKNPKGAVRESILEATDGITPEDTMDLLDAMNPDKNKQEEH